MASLRAFVRVVEAGNFTRASDSLGVPKATISKLIQVLEARVRTKLLSRTTRRVTVTPDGAAYYERVLRILTELDELDGSMSSSQANPTGRLRIDVGSSVAVMCLIPALPRFFERYPDIEIDLGATDRTVDLLGENVDCVIRAGEILDQSLVARRIGQLTFTTAATPEYLQRFGEPQHPSELDTQHQVVGYFNAGTGKHYPLEFVRGGELIEIKGQHKISTNDGNAYLAAAMAHLGIVQAPQFMLRDHLEAGRLRPILQEWTSVALPVHIVYPPNRHISNKLRVFVDWAAELFSREHWLRAT